METCARCGHTTPTCEQCGKDDLLLGGRIGDEDYCHTFSESTPTCYTLESWARTEQSLTPEGRALTADVRQALNELRERTTSRG